MVEARIGDVLYYNLGTAGFPFGHAGITWFGDGGLWSIEVRGTISRVDLGKLGSDPGIVYRCSNQLFAAEAASVAQTWSLLRRDTRDTRQGGLTGGTQNRAVRSVHQAKQSKYGYLASGASAIVIPWYGPFAKRRARKYREARRSIDGPASMYHHGLIESKLFCSMFVAAVLQAATASENELHKYIKLDARHTSPLNLGNYLEKNPEWTRIDWEEYSF